MKLVDALDLDDKGPQIVKLGRLHRVVVECYAPENATPEQIQECIESELGSGGIGPDNPLYHDGVEVLSVRHDHDMNLIGYTLWEADNERGDRKRHGSTVLRHPGEPIGVSYNPTPPSTGEGE